MDDTDNLDEYNNEYIYYNGIKYKLTKRLCDIKKKYRNKKLYRIYSWINRRKDEPYRKGKGKFCDAPILMKLSNNNKF